MTPLPTPEPSCQIDGIYGPQTVAVVEELQKANGLPVTGAVDKATARRPPGQTRDARRRRSPAGHRHDGGDPATLKLVGFWDGPVDGVWTPALKDAVKAFQTHSGVEPTGPIDAATISAFEKALAQAKQPQATPTPTPST